MTFVEVFRPDESIYPKGTTPMFHCGMPMFTKPDVLKFVATQFTTLPRVDL